MNTTPNPIPASTPPFDLAQAFKDAQALADVQASGFDEALARIRQRRLEAPDSD